MTEEKEWLACERSGQMLGYIREKISARKLRLFGVACCRHVWHRLKDVRSRRAVELSEDLADYPDPSPADWEAVHRARYAAEVVAKGVWTKHCNGRAEEDDYLAAWAAARTAQKDPPALRDLVLCVFG